MTNFNDFLNEQMKDPHLRQNGKHSTRNFP